jgi:hypothetical protein
VVIELVLLYRIIPASAHAAFYKGAQYFKIKHHMVPVDPVTRKADLGRVRRAMSVFFFTSPLSLPSRTYLKMNCQKLKYHHGTIAENLSFSKIKIHINSS